MGDVSFAIAKFVSMNLKSAQVSLESPCIPAGICKQLQHTCILLQRLQLPYSNWFTINIEALLCLNSEKS